MNRRQHQQGIALITTLIMLSVVTLMAVAFLAVSRRERASVTTSTDRQDAKAMAEAALQRAEAEIISRVLAASNVLSYDLLVSTNFIHPQGFEKNRDNTNYSNVSYLDRNGNALTAAELPEMYRNLMVDPRVPVFIETNRNTGENDFRYFIDYNRNGRFDTNGYFAELVNDGTGLKTGATNFNVGDPEWIGVLRRPDQPHSGSNLFVGRFAYLILPVGKTLDLNYIHNHAKRNGAAQEGFLRNQGVGSWEINLAAFLHDLNTNQWNTYDYVYNNLFSSSRGVAFEDAFFLLNNRFTNSVNDLRSITFSYGAAGSGAFETDGIDGYTDGPLQFDINRPYTGTNAPFTILEDDVATRPWPGSDSPRQMFDLQEIFSIDDVRALVSPLDTFTNRLVQASLGQTTYDRHTFYRLLGQLGTDSTPNNQSRIHLTYDNRLDFDPNLAGRSVGPGVGYHATNFVRWTPLAFFTNTADRILKATHPPAGPRVPLVSVTNIAVWPTNFYSPAVHHALQLAANIFDATTNRNLSPIGPAYPSVFRPVYGPDPSVNGGLRILRYEELGADWAANFWNPAQYDVDESEDRPNVRQYEGIYGIPLVIGAKKGYPNFNEFRMRTVAVAGRKLALTKRNKNELRPSFTNQLYTLGISNALGIEFWNSYRTPYPRPIELRVMVDNEIVLSNATRVVWAMTNRLGYTNTFPANTWLGEQFILPIQTNIIFLPMSGYRAVTGQIFPLRTNDLSNLPINLFESGIGFPVPTWRLNVTNRLRAVLIDQGVAGGRIVDYVSLDNLVTHMDVTQELFGNLDNANQSSVAGSFWITNRVRGVPQGISEQIQASLGAINVSDWNSASAEPVQGSDKLKAIADFRQFVGLSGSADTSGKLYMQAPFSPGRKIVQEKSWQVNDPLVNDLFWDLEDPMRTNVFQPMSPFAAIPDEQGGLGQVNKRYRPWREDPNVSSKSVDDPGDFEFAVKDPQITRSDDWDFPTNSFPAIGWLGRVHRGTPWQTVYLKSAAVTPNKWQNWSGHPIWRWPNNFIPLGTQPTNDWRILDLFTTAVNENAARGQLSVNQSGLAAWSAVLAGVPVFTNSVSTNFGAFVVQPSSLEVQTIVDGINLARQLRSGRRFSYLGEVLSTPQLSELSPFLKSNTGKYMPIDPVVERVPQMTLSLLRADEPRFAVYAFGQSLRPAPGSVITDFDRYFQMPTNYIITGEFVTKTLMHLEATLEIDPQTRQERLSVRPVKETYNEVPPTE
ncbi:MAG: hypothetical protein JNK85_14895 [Verrucomicrobiales bacterium]|nr:hypothetical protein [Verrucomicrobiales bacterium]